MRHMYAGGNIAGICELKPTVDLIEPMTLTIYGTVTCVECLRRAIAESEERARVLRTLLAKAVLA